MPAPVQSRLRRVGRQIFRAVRIGILLLLLAVVVAGIYLNQIGLPDFLKRPLLEELRTRGVELQFSRLRLRWYRGIVAEDVQFGRAAQPEGPQLTLREVEFRLNHAALKKLEFTVESLVLHHGRFVWPLLATHQPAKTLSLEEIESELHLLPQDRWELDRFQARFAGAKVQLTGVISNASAVRDWKFFHPGRPAEPALVQERLRKFVETLETIKFSAPPELKLELRGDARDWQTFNGVLTLRTPGADTPWGAATNILLSTWLSASSALQKWPDIRLNLEADSAQTPWANTRNLQLALHLVSGERWPEVRLNLEADDAQTPWAKAGKPRLDLHLVSVETQTNLISGELAFSAGQTETQWGQSSGTHLTARWMQSVTNPVPVAGTGELQLTNARSRWGNADSLQLTARLSTPPTHTPSRANENWAWWARLERYWLDWECRLTQIQSPKLEADELFSAGRWRAPELTLTNLHAKLYEGQLDARLSLNVATREASFQMNSDFDVHRMSPWLTEKAQAWIQQFSWETPPRLHGQGFAVLPAWTNRQPDWRGEVVPTLRLQGQFQSGPGAYRGLPVTSAQSHLTFSNMIWHLPDLAVTRPEGRLDLVHRADDRTKDFYWRVQGAIDVRAVRPLLEPPQQRGLDYFTFTQPPRLDGEVWGRWHARERTGFKGQVTLTNFTFRGETASRFRAALDYTNECLTLFDAEILRGEQRVAADGVGVDFRARKVYLTNGFSTTEPMAVARAIGSKTAHTLEPYQFIQPPTARVSGVAPMDGTSDADLHFDLEGGPFEWWKFRVPHISGQVHWTGEWLTLTNVQAAFYEGQLTGAAEFDFRPEQGSDFNFALTATNVDLRLLTRDLSAHTNQLEGLISGQWTIAKANSADWQSWQGRGDVKLRDGMVWEIPIFGVFSPVLDGIIPGLGKSRFSEGTADFVITNNIIHSENLEIRAPMLRMQYRGDVDFQGRVDARVEAEILRDTWLIGPAVRLALWPVSKVFESKVTGTLSDPKSEPVYVPKLLLLPLHPFRTLKELFQGDSSRPNAPPPARTP